MKAHFLQRPLVQLICNRKVEHFQQNFIASHQNPAFLVSDVAVIPKGYCNTYNFLCFGTQQEMKTCSFKLNAEVVVRLSSTTPDILKTASAESALVRYQVSFHAFFLRK